MTVGSPLPADLQTPCLVVDRDVLDANLSAMASHARDSGVFLRPHAKTHKCVEIAHRQLALGAVGLTVATVGEGEVFADAGFTDVFIAYPLWAAGARGVRLRALAERVSLRVGVDSSAGAEVLARALGALRQKCWSRSTAATTAPGWHRSTPGPSRWRRSAAGCACRGYSPSQDTATAPASANGPQPTRLARWTRRPTRWGSRHGGRAAQRRIHADGGAAAVRGAERAPSWRVRLQRRSAGRAGAASWESVALTAAATVVSRNGRNLVLDAGSKVLGADRPAWATGHGRLLDHPEARVTALSEHHATVSFPEDGLLPELGSVVRVVPNHVCTAVNLADDLVVVADGAVVAHWLVAARGKNV